MAYLTLAFLAYLSMKKRPNKLERLSMGSLSNLFQLLPIKLAIIRQGCKDLQGTNTLAYYEDP
jgi:hypothetical protein